MLKKSIRILQDFSESISKNPKDEPLKTSKDPIELQRIEKCLILIKHPKFSLKDIFPKNGGIQKRPVLNT